MTKLIYAIITVLLGTIVIKNTLQDPDDITDSAEENFNGLSREDDQVWIKTLTYTCMTLAGIGHGGIYPVSALGHGIVLVLTVLRFFLISGILKDIFDTMFNNITFKEKVENYISKKMPDIKNALQLAKDLQQNTQINDGSYPKSVTSSIISQFNSDAENMV